MAKDKSGADFYKNALFERLENLRETNEHLFLLVFYEVLKQTYKTFDEWELFEKLDEENSAILLDKIKRYEKTIGLVTDTEKNV